MHKASRWGGVYLRKQTVVDSQNERDRPVYRGVELPDGMTPECLDTLASLFNDYEAGLLRGADGIAGPAEAAVMAFRQVAETGPGKGASLSLAEFVGAPALARQMDMSESESRQAARIVILAIKSAGVCI